MFGNKKLIIGKKEGIIAYDVYMEKANYDVTIENGLQCVTFKNGVKGESLYSSAQKTVVSNKDGSGRVVAVDRTSVFSVRCGCSGVAYTDYEIDMETTVGMNGVADIKVVNPNRFVEVFASVKEVNVVVLEDYFRTNFSQAMGMALSAALNQYGKDAEGQLYMMGEQLKNFLGQKVTDIGLSIEKFTLNNIHFADDYKKAREDYFAKKKEERELKRQKREEREEEDRELDVLDRLSKMNQQKASKTEEGVYCSVCGTKNKVGTAFCVKCGNKIK